MGCLPLRRNTDRQRHVNCPGRRRREDGVQIVNVALGPLIGEKVAEFHDLVSEQIATAPRVTRNPYFGDRSGIAGARSRK